MEPALIQIVDKNDAPVGSATKEKAQTEGLAHRIVIILIRDGEGHVLLQRRAPSVKLYPNCWDHSAAGHVDAGEDYETAAKRELREELGVSGVLLQEATYYYSEKEVAGRRLNRFHKAYQVVLPRNTTFSLQPEEVAAVHWFTHEEVLRLIAEHPEDVTGGVRTMVERGLV